MGCTNSVGKNSFKIEQFKVGLLELTFKILSFSLHFIFPPSNFKLLYLCSILNYRDVSPHFGNLRNSILSCAISWSHQKNSMKPRERKKKLGNCYEHPLLEKEFYIGNIFIFVLHLKRGNTCNINRFSSKCFWQARLTRLSITILQMLLICCLHSHC